MNYQVSKDANSEIADLKKVKNELSGTEQSKILTDKDIAQAESAMNDLQKELQTKGQIKKLLEKQVSHLK